MRNDLPVSLMEKGSVGVVTPEKIQFDTPLALDCGRTLPHFELMVETYGRLNASCTNAVLICHALSGDHHVAGVHSADDKKPGWWDNCVGPGKPIDTTKFFVVALNNLGGCKGSTGPNTANPETGKPWGPDFPLLTVSDWVRSQAALADHFGIAAWAAVVGGSLGGMQVQAWAIEYPARIRHALIIASAPELSAQNIAFNEIARQAILSDPEFHGGHFYEHRVVPSRGLKLARMLGHITYLSDAAMRAKFGVELKAATPSFNFDVEFEVESYLRHQGQSFVDRFDANTYLLMTKALDYFDPARDHGGDLVQAYAKATAQFLVIAFSSDWRFSPARSREIVQALVAAGKDVSYVEIESELGHDDFLMPIPQYHRVLKNYLDRVAGESAADSGEHCSPPHSRPAGMPDAWSAQKSEVSPRTANSPLRPDLALIAEWIAPGQRLLDLGCGDGALLAHLARHKQVRGYGLEIDAENVAACIASGVNVIQADLDEGLSDFGDAAFDVVVMTQALQALQRPDEAVEEMLRVGKTVIVTFPNFGHWRVRWALLRGQMPVTPSLPEQWFNTPNIHLCTVKDFEALCARRHWQITDRALLNHAREGGFLSRVFPNLFAEVALFELRPMRARFAL